jgi:uncharacterized protein YecT (DUF1311 family)
MSSRDRTQQILSVKQRDTRWSRFGSFTLEKLLRDWKKRSANEACEPDFYTIRAVTLLEVFTRRNLAELIDHGREFTDRALEFSKHLKIDFGLVRDIQGRTITLGDILSHSVPVNAFGQISSYFETLLGKPLRPLLEAAVDRVSVEVTKTASGPIISDFDALARWLTRLFEVRHILCHEAPLKAIYEVREIDEFLNNSIQFAKALEEVLKFEKFGLVPLTQTDMNIAANEDLKSVESKMNQLVSTIEGKIVESGVATVRSQGTSPSWLDSFREEQSKWLSYREAHCDFHTYLNQGGTIRPLLWATEANRLTVSRAAYLESWLKRDSEK